MKDLPPVTTLLKIHYRSGYEQECLQWMEETAAIAGSFPGFQDKEIYRSAEEENLLLNIFTFKTPKELEAWEQSELRKLQTRKGETIFDSIVEKRQLSGLEFWFQPNKSAPKIPLKWKMVVVTVVVIFLLLNTVTPLLQKTLTVFGLPQLLKSLFGVAVMVCLMTYLIMPILSRLLSAWLSRR